jgi:hypothetical protein
MVSQDEGKTILNGNPSLIHSEIAALLHYGAKMIAEQLDTSYDDVLSNIMDGAGIYKLMESGMTQVEAMDTLGMTDKVAKSTTISPDGTEEVTYEKGK